MLFLIRRPINEWAAASYVCTRCPAFYQRGRNMNKLAGGFSPAASVGIIHSPAARLLIVIFGRLTMGLLLLTAEEIGESLPFSVNGYLQKGTHWSKLLSPCTEQRCFYGYSLRLFSTWTPNIANFVSPILARRLKLVRMCSSESGGFYCVWW